MSFYTGLLGSELQRIVENFFFRGKRIGFSGNFFRSGKSVISFLLLFSTANSVSLATNYYWVGGTGNWSQFATHWATTSGGSVFQTQVPTSADNVYFDANSFTAAGQTVTVDQVIYCNDMDWTGSLNNPTFAGPFPNNLNLYGSLTFAPGVIDNYGGDINFQATTPGKTITSASTVFKADGLWFRGVGGGWTLMDSLTTATGVSGLFFATGTFNTNNQKITTREIQTTGAGNYTLNLGSSLITLTHGDIGIAWDMSSGSVVNAGTSCINFTQWTIWPPYFWGGGHTYNNVSFASSNVSAQLQDNNTFNNLSFSCNATIQNNQTCNSLFFLNPGTTITISSGSTQTISGAGQLYALGSGGSLITIQSSTGGSQFTFSKSAGSVCLDYVKMQDSKAMGGATFNDGPNGQNVSGNTGWLFTGCGTSINPPNSCCSCQPTYSISVTTTSVTCYGQCNGAAIVSAGGGSSPYSYSWYPSGGATATAQNLCAGNYTVTVTDAASVVVSYAFSLSQPAAVPVSVTTNQTICLGTPQVLSSSGANTYSWSPGTYLSSTTGSVITATPTVSGGYTYSVTGTDVHGCSNTAAVNINVVSSITASAGSDEVTCSGLTTNLNGSGGSTYMWSPGTGLTNNTSAVTSFTITTPGNYTYTLTAYLGLGCTSTDAVQVTVYNLPTVTSSSDQTICTGSTVSLSASGGNTYSWSPKTYLNSNTGSMVNSVPTVSGITHYTVTVTDVNGCISKQPITVTAGSIPTLSTIASESVCAGSNTTITVTGSAGSYSWNPVTGISNATSGTTTISQPAGTYSYTLTLTGQLCRQSTSKVLNITMYPLPTLSTSQDETICSGGSTVISASGAITYTWSSGTSPSTGNAVTVTPATSTSYTVTGTDQNGCSASSAITVTPVTPAATANDVTINQGDTITLNISSNGIYYQWRPANGLSCTNCNHPTASPGTTTKYYVTITYANGCTIKDSVKVTVKDKCGEIYVPTAFSPNGDNENDVWYVKTLNNNCIRTMKLEIYDRWGNLVFLSTDITKGWDGRLLGRELNSDVFVYSLQAKLADGTSINRKGNVSLIK